MEQNVLLVVHPFYDTDGVALLSETQEQKYWCRAIDLYSEPLRQLCTKATIIYPPFEQNSTALIQRQFIQQAETICGLSHVFVNRESKAERSAPMTKQFLLKRISDETLLKSIRLFAYGEYLANCVVDIACYLHRYLNLSNPLTILAKHTHTQSYFRPRSVEQCRKDLLEYLDENNDFSRDAVNVQWSLRSRAVRTLR